MVINGKSYYKVGAEVDESMSIQDQMVASGLNWQVLTSPQRFGRSSEFISQGGENVAMYRVINENGQRRGVLLDNVSPDWKPHQPKEVVEAVNEFAIASGAKLERLGCLDEGRIIFAGLHDPQGYTVGGNSVGDVLFHKIIVTSYNLYGRASQIHTMTTRLVCSNGMTRSVKVKNLSVDHRTLFDKTKVNLLFTQSQNEFTHNSKVADALANVPLSYSEAVAWVIGQVGSHDHNNEPLNMDEQPEIVHQVLKLFQGAAMGSELVTAYRTAWGLLNAYTEYQNHHVKARKGVEAHVKSLWYGDRSKQQNSFQDKLVSVYAPSLERATVSVSATAAWANSQGLGQPVAAW